jgi:hypothetical protein
MDGAASTIVFERYCQDGGSTARPALPFGGMRRSRSP